MVEQEAKLLKIIGLHPDDPVLKRTFSDLTYSFVRLISNQEVKFECTLERPLGLKVFLCTNLLSESEEQSELILMESDNDKDYHITFKVSDLRKGYLRVLIESEKKGHFYYDAFKPTAVEVQPEGIELLKMYSMIPLASGHMKHWNAKLREIKAMGFDCVHLLPITKMGASQSPYSAADLYEIDPMYASSIADFEVFVRNAKSLKLRLCFDLVLNHISPDSQLAKDNPDWIVPDTTESDGLKRAGCWHEASWIRWDDLVLINFEHPDITTRTLIWNELKKYAMYWAKFAAETNGMLRLDNLHSSNEAFVTMLRQEIKEHYPDLIIFAEFFADDKELALKTYEWDLNLLLGQPWHYDFIPQLREYFQKVHSESLQLHHVTPITTHDTPSIQQMYSDSCFMIPRYAASSFLSCGKTGITMGVELAEQEKLKFIGKPYDLDISKDHPFKLELKRINDLLSQEKTLRQNSNLIFIDHGHEALLVALRKDRLDRGNDLIVAISMDKHHEQGLHVNLDSSLGLGDNVSFIELGVQEQIEIKSSTYITLKPCSYRLFKRKS